MNPKKNAISNQDLKKLEALAMQSLLPGKGWKKLKNGNGFDPEISPPAALIIGMLCREIKRLRKEK